MFPLKQRFFCLTTRRISRSCRSSSAISCDRNSSGGCGDDDKMVFLHHTTNYEDFVDLMKNLNGTKVPTFVLFTGSSDETGHSWCSDCVEAEPTITKQIELNQGLLKESNLVFAQVGSRDDWKNNNENPFKLDKKIRLQFLPTLLKWGTLHRLQVKDCLKPDLINMLFEDSEDHF